MNELYPLKFHPIVKEAIWGGNQLKRLLNKDTGNIKKAAESWEISGVMGDVSVVLNGPLQGNNIQELIEVYMGDLVGDAVYDKFGIEFPLLIKFIDANDILSIQVHPNDELSEKRHKAFGKTEMWYVLEAEKDSFLISGFNKEINKGIYLDHFNHKKLPEVLNYEKVSKGDVFYIPAGRIHAIGPGILLAEIQQTSDVTYRIYDWDRVDKNGNGRELHTELALEAIDFSHVDNYKTSYKANTNETSLLVSCPYFTTNILNFDKIIDKDYVKTESFVIYMCMEGAFSLHYNSGILEITKGETILLPASLNEFRLDPSEKTILLEISKP